jgi:hypothetical protein
MRIGGCEVNSSDSLQERVVNCCGHGSKYLDFAKCEKILDKLSSNLLPKNGPVPCSLLFYKL